MKTHLSIMLLATLVTVSLADTIVAYAQDRSIVLRRERLATAKFRVPGYQPRQANAIRKLRENVGSFDERDPAAYMARLRFGLRAVFGDVKRGPDETRMPTKGALRAARERRSPFDRDPVARRNVDSFLRDAELGLRVIGGERITPENDFFLHAVALRPYMGGTAMGTCTGVLVNEEAVLTAGHCVCDLLGGQNLSGVRLLAIFGANAPSRLSAALQVGRDVDLTKTKLFDQRFCKKYSRTSRLWYGFDIAVVFLRRPAPENVKPAVLAPPELYLSRTTNALTVVGYGINSRTDRGFGDRPKFHAAIAIGSKLCDGHDGGLLYVDCVPGREMILNDWYYQRDTCRGDSGGPAYLYDGSNYYVAAITSRAFSGARCGPGGIYSVITPQVRAWLDKVAPLPDPVVDGQQPDCVCDGEITPTQGSQQ